MIFFVAKMTGIVHHKCPEVQFYPLSATVGAGVPLKHALHLGAEGKQFQRSLPGEGTSTPQISLLRSAPTV